VYLQPGLPVKNVVKENKIFMLVSVGKEWDVTLFLGAMMIKKC
jgi:hypothetical protein